jgi:hypothetical protein
MEHAPAPFIVGVGRSGTTLLRLMLDAHPEMAIPAETHFLTDLAGRDAKDFTREEFLHVVTGAQTWPNMAMEPAELAGALDGIKPFSVAEGLRLFYRLYARRFGKERWGDKTPTYRACMPGIQELMPEASFIHIIRDGRDVALSYRGLWFGPGDDLETQAKFWVEQIGMARRDSAQLRRYMEVKYEELVMEPGTTLGKICEWLQLEFHPSMLDYHKSAPARMAEYVRSVVPANQPAVSAERYASIHERTGQPPDRGRIDRWRTEMPEEQLRRFEAMAGALLTELGYETSSKG